MDQLARLRELKGLSQRALAKESGVSPATIYELENGRRRPNPSTLRKLARALDVEVAGLLGADYPKAGAPSSPEQPPLNGFEEERRQAAYDLALDAARRQARQDVQAFARAIESGRPQTYFVRYDNEAMYRLLGYPTGDLAEATLEMAHRVVEGEQRPSPLAAPLIAVISHWQEIVSNSPAESAAGAVNLALELEDQLSVLVGEEKQWSRVTPVQRAEIFRLMKLIEELAERYVTRMETEAGAEVIDLDDLRRRLEQRRESRLQAEAHSA